MFYTILIYNLNEDQLTFLNTYDDINQARQKYDEQIKRYNIEDEPNMQVYVDIKLPESKIIRFETNDNYIVLFYQDPTYYPEVFVQLINGLLLVSNESYEEDEYVEPNSY